jgi:hypothetical protein
MPGKFQHILISGTITAELPSVIVTLIVGFSIANLLLKIKITLKNDS